MWCPSLPHEGQKRVLRTPVTPEEHLIRLYLHSVLLVGQRRERQAHRMTGLAATQTNHAVQGCLHLPQRLETLHAAEALVVRARPTEGAHDGAQLPTSGGTVPGMVPEAIAPMASDVGAVHRLVVGACAEMARVHHLVVGAVRHSVPHLSAVVTLDGDVASEVPGAPSSQTHSIATRPHCAHSHWPTFEVRLLQLVLALDGVGQISL